MKFLKKYSIFLVALVALIMTFIFNAETGNAAVKTIISSFKEMLLILPPIFVLLGLLDVWVPREVMGRFMGEDSGLLGALLAFFLGSAAAGPLYVVFPVAATFMKKGAKFSNILILMGAWSTTKIPMFLFELSSLGTKFAFTRLAINIPMILLIAFIMTKAISEEEVKEIYLLAEQQD